MSPAPPRSASWLQTSAILRVLAVLLITAASLWLTFTVRRVLLLLVLTVFFAYLMAPLVELLQRPRHAVARPWLPRPLAVAIAYVLVLGAVGVALALVLPGFGRQLGQLGGEAPTVLAKLSARIQELLGGDWARALPDPMRNTLGHALSQAGPKAAAWVEGAVVVAVGYLPFVIWLVLVPVLGFFLLADAPALRVWLVRSFPQGRSRWRGHNLFDEVNRALAKFIRAQLLACLLIGVASAVGLVALGLPYPLPLGALSGVLEFIPMVGPALFILTACSIALFAGHLPATIIFFLALRLTQDYLIYPRMIGRGLELHPAAVMVVLLCGAEIDGVAGLFLAVPLLAIGSAAVRFLKKELGTESLIASLQSLGSVPEDAPPKP